MTAEGYPAVHSVRKLPGRVHLTKMGPYAMVNVATTSYIECMKAVGLRVLKNKLAEYVRLAAAGEVILVTDRETVVAELRPPQPGRAETVGDAVLAEMVRSGVVTPAARGQGIPPRRPVQDLGSLLEDLRQDRTDR